jgi:hypothetical protein
VKGNKGKQEKINKLILILSISSVGSDLWKYRRVELGCLGGLRSYKVHFSPPLPPLSAVLVFAFSLSSSVYYIHIYLFISYL